MKLISIPKTVAGGLDTVGMWIFFGVVTIFCAWVFAEFLGNSRALGKEA